MSTVETPFYSLSLNGTPLDSTRMDMIQEISYEDNETGSDLLTITLNDPDLVFLNDNIFLEDVPVHFEGGVEGRIDVVFDGYISILDGDLPEEGAPSLTIHCMDATHLMSKTKKTRTWNNVIWSDVAIQIFREYGLTPIVDNTTDRIETLTQSNQYDIDFLAQGAQSEAKDFYICYVEGNTGYFVKRKLVDTPQATCSYRQDDGTLLSFSPRVNKETKDQEVVIMDVNIDNKLVEEAKANEATLREQQGSSLIVKATKI